MATINENKILHSKLVWSEINTIARTERASENQITYSFNGGFQTLSILDRGDVNHNKVQGIVILSRDSVENGNYFNFRLFVLSINKKEQWLALDQ